MTVLVIGEHDNQSLAAPTLNAVTAARTLDGAVDVLVAGHDCRTAAEAAARVEGVGRVLMADASHYARRLAEEIAPLVVRLAPDYRHILTAATTGGKDLLPRAAALLDVAAISDVTDIVSADTFTRPAYAGNVMLTVRSRDELKLLTVRATSFDAAPARGGTAEIESVEATPVVGLSEFVDEELTQSERPDLMGARVVVSGGRGMGSAENFALVEEVADRLKGAVGASRAAVDAGYAPNDYQVGQTGKIVAPDLYIAAGISGAIQHLAGMKDSKVVVAVNKDEEAPIFQVADYGLVADLFEALPALCDELNNH